MKKYFSVSTEQYPFHILFSLGQDSKELVASMKESGLVLGEEEEKLMNFPEDDFGVTVPFEGGAVLVWVREFSGDPDSHGRVAHEIFHATEWLMRWIGIKPGKKSSEAYAYMIQFLTTKFNTEILNAKDRGNKKRAHKK